MTKEEFRHTITKVRQVLMDLESELIWASTDAEMQTGLSDVSSVAVEVTDSDGNTLWKKMKQLKK
jgi:hypothetical protein